MIERGGGELWPWVLVVVVAVVLLHVASINGGPIMCFNHGSWLRSVVRERERMNKNNFFNIILATANWY